MMRIRSLLLAGATALALAVASPVSHAAMPVVDASNLAQNILQATRMMEEINNQVIQIQHMVRMLENDARNLTGLGSSNLDGLNGSLATLQRLMSQAEGIVYDVDRAEQQFRQLYPQEYDAAVTTDQLYQDAHRRWQTSVAALDHSIRAQSRIVTDIAADQQSMAQAMSASQNAVGILQANQATNQLIALQVKQTSELQAMLAAHARAQDLELARQAAAEEAARVQRRQFLGTGISYTPQPVQIFR